jgi:two-component system phosphate regulon response regulator PhoB
MKSILLADDEENLRVLVHETLEGADYEIVEASDGEEAIEMARRRRPDLMVLDWMMPGKTGVEVSAALRREQSTRDIPIILLTAKNQQDDIVTAFDSGVTSYLVKPFSPAELLDKVEELLGA